MSAWREGFWDNRVLIFLSQKFRATPGYIIFLAIAYSILATKLNHLIGRSLAPLKYEKQKFDANFRYGLMRLRESAEQIALQGGEPAELLNFKDSFKYIIGNFLKINKVQRNLFFFQSGYLSMNMMNQALP